MTAQRVVLGFVALLALLIAAVPARAADPLPLHATPVALDPRDPARTTLGKLVYRGGLILESADARFGGWSDLHVSADGARLVSISDHGFWFTADLVYGADGRLASLADARIGPLIDLEGRPVVGDLSDAEGLAKHPNGGFYVSFEREHRIWFYPAADPPFSRPPLRVPTPPRLQDAPRNGGIEALMHLADGRLMMLVEELTDGRDNHVGWIGDSSGEAWRTLHDHTGRDFKPTGLTQIPPDMAGAGDVLALERRFTFTAGAGARIVRLRKADLRPGAQLDGELLAEIDPPLTLDNFEGIAVTRGAQGRARIYIVSDDNYTFLQRTLLLMFELAPAK